MAEVRRHQVHFSFSVIAALLLLIAAFILLLINCLVHFFTSTIAILLSLAYDL